METVCFRRVIEADTIVSTLVKNIYEHDAYQSYLEELGQDPDKEKKIKKIHETFADIRVFNTNTNPLFLAADIGLLLGISSINALIKNFTVEEKIEGEVDLDGSIKKRMFLTRHGVYRVVFNSRTKLAELFRSFVYKLIDHMMENENKKLTQILTQIKEMNPQLVQDTIDELNSNYIDYKVKYEMEQQRREIIEEELNEKKNDIIGIQVENSFRSMYINDLLEKKKTLIGKLSAKRENDPTADLKKRYMKEILIYIVNPNVVESIKKKMTEKELKVEKEYIDSYLKNFKFNSICAKDSEGIDESEMVYLNVEFKTRQVKDMYDNKCYVTNDWVHSKEHYNKLIEELKDITAWYDFPSHKNKYVFRCSIDDVRDIVNTLL